MKRPANANLIATQPAYPGLGILRVRNIGRYKFLVTFATKKNMEELLEVRHDIFMEVFDDVSA